MSNWGRSCRQTPPAQISCRFPLLWSIKQATNQQSRLRDRLISLAATGESGPLRPPPRPADFKLRIAQQFDTRAPRYDAGNTYHPPQAARLVKLAALQEGEEVLDVGTGTGLVALEAARLVGSSGKVTGVDLSDAMIHQAAMKAQGAGLTNLRLLAADIEECGFGEGRFDAILCSNALPFLPDIPAALAIWHSWLRPGGRLLFNAPKGVGSRAFTIFAQVAAEQGLLLEDPCRLFAEETQVQELLKGAGYASASISVTAETNLRAGQTREQWAASGWALCTNMPFADMAAAVGEEGLDEMRRQYLPAAEKVAAGMATAEGIAEPYEMMWVVAQA